MSELLFPAGTVIELSNLDIEGMNAYGKQWKLEHKQMQSGVFSGALCVVNTPRIQIYDAHYSHGLMIRGEFPENCVILTYSRTKSEVSQYNEKVKADRVVILTKGDEIDYFASGESEVFTLAVEKELFFKAFSNYFGESFELHQYQKHFLLQPKLIEDFITVMTSWITYLKSTYSDTEYEKIEAAILGGLFEGLDLNKDYTYTTPSRVHAIRKILDTSVQEYKSISEIPDDIGLSERHILRMFKNTFGISPKKYLQQLRLNAVRKELLLHHKKQVHIHDIALKHNFFHMGYFSAEYKKFFGELPSKTLKRAD